MPAGLFRWGWRTRLAPRARSPVLLVEEGAQRLGAAGVAQLAQRLGLDLADPLAGDVELLADLLEGVVGVHVDAEAHAQHLGLARSEERRVGKECRSRWWPGP